MRRTSILIMALMLLIVPLSVSGYSDLEAQMEKVFTFVGLNNPEISVGDNEVVVKLNLPSTFTEQGTLSYIFVNAAAIAPHTETITIEISSDLDAGVTATMDTQVALDFSDGLVTETEFNDALKLKRVRSSVDILFMFLTLVVIAVVGFKLFTQAHLQKSHGHIHENHPVHHYMKEEKPKKKKKAPAKKKKAAKKKRK